jgi:hypothetical protein
MGALCVALLCPAADAQVDPGAAARSRVPMAGPDIFALSHFFALSRATDPRFTGMGGAYAAVVDVDSSSPAHVAAATEPTWNVFAGQTDFENGPRFTGQALRAVLPLPSTEAQDGIGLIAFRMRSSQDLLGIAPFEGRFTETDVAMQYGCYLSPELLAGISLSPLMQTRVNLYDPGSGFEMMRVSAHQGFGARTALTYLADDRLSFGLVYDDFSEKAALSIMLPPETAPDRGSRQVISLPDASYRSRLLRVGMAYHIDSKTIVAYDWEQTHFTGGGIDFTEASDYYGIERQLNDKLALRVGSFANSLSAGLGFRLGGVDLEYGYVQDMNKDTFSTTGFGGSKTHYLSIAGAF